MTLTEIQKERLQAYLIEDEDELLLDLAGRLMFFSPDGVERRTITLDRRPSEGLRKSELLKKAENFIQNNKSKIKQRICDEWNLCEKIESKKFESNFELGVALVSVLTHVLPQPALLIVVAILVKRNLKKLCDC